MSLHCASARKCLFRALKFVRAICVIGAVCVGNDVSGVELVKNGSFEEGTPPLGGGPLLSEWDDAPGIGNDLGFDPELYPFYEFGMARSGDGGFGLPPGALEPSFTGLIAPEDAGKYYASQWGIANGRGFGGSVTQRIGVSRHAGKAMTFSAWVAGRRGDSEHAIVSLEFFDEAEGSGSPLAGFVFDGGDQTSPYIIGSLNLDRRADPTIPATQNNWTLYRTTGAIPADALSATIVIRGAGDGYVDLVSLRVVPEPTTGLLLLSMLSPLLLGRCAYGS